MIVRIVNEGQWTVPETAHAKLNLLDDLIAKSVDKRDHEELARLLTEMGDLVRRLGTPMPAPVPPDTVSVSDMIVPAAGTPMREIREWMDSSNQEEGLIPD